MKLKATKAIVINSTGAECVNRHLYRIVSGGEGTGYFHDETIIESPTIAALYFAERDSIDSKPVMHVVWEYNEQGESAEYKRLYARKTD